MLVVNTMRNGIFFYLLIIGICQIIGKFFHFVTNYKTILKFWNIVHYALNRAKFFTDLYFTQHTFTILFCFRSLYFYILISILQYATSSIQNPVIYSATLSNVLLLRRNFQPKRISLWETTAIYIFLVCRKLFLWPHLTPRIIYLRLGSRCVLRTISSLLLRSSFFFFIISFIFLFYLATSSRVCSYRESLASELSAVSLR